MMSFEQCGPGLQAAALSPPGHYLSQSSILLLHYREIKAALAKSEE